LNLIYSYTLVNETPLVNSAGTFTLKVKLESVDAPKTDFDDWDSRASPFADSPVDNFYEYLPQQH